MLMNKKQLMKRLQEIEASFNTLSEQKTQAEDEMKRLQGEHRVVTDLISQLSPSAENLSASPQKIEVQDAPNQ